MFGPDYTAGCPHCSAIADGFDGFDFYVWFSEEQQREGSIEYNYRRGGHAMDEEGLANKRAQRATPSRLVIRRARAAFQ